MISKWKTFFSTVAVLGLLINAAAATPGDVWSLSGDWSLASNPAPAVDPGAVGGGTGTWSYHSGGAPNPFTGVPTAVSLYGLTSSGDISALVNPELPDQGDVWQNAIGDHIVLGKYSVASVSPPDNTDFLPGNVGGHADTGATWTTDHAGTFLVDYLGYNARASNAGGLINMDLIDPAGPTLLERTILDPGAPGNFPGKFQGIANAVLESTILTLPAGGGVRFVMSNNDWTGMDMTITELSDAPPVEYTIDETLSSLTVSGTALGFTLQGQGGAASLTSNLEGTISARVSGNLLTFLGGSVIDVKQNVNAPFDPAGDPGDEDNFGGEVSFTAVAAIRNVVLDIVSGSAAFGSSVSSLGIELTDGKVEYDAGFLGSGTTDLTGETATNQATDLLQQSIVGNVETITIPILFPLQDDDFDLLIEGQIVASRTLPVSGDFDGDGNVDGSDLTLWEGDFGANGDSDADDDGDSDGADFLIWQRNFTNSQGSVAVVPEPSTLLLIGVCYCILCFSRAGRV